jgi:hypothetical protein|tara:strand:- start:641 stop:898 length:258 start_codon:yes stop_codon:yes gene_type:complete
MDDPTGGMWIYLIFIIIPLARILPRLLRKYRKKSVVSEPDEQYSQREFFASEGMAEPPRFREKEPPEPQPKPEKKDGWVGKDDFR